MRRYAFTRAHARALVWIGWTVFVTGVLIGVLFALGGARGGLADYFAGKGYAEPVARALSVGFVVIVGTIAGVVLATPFIVSGHLVLIALDQRALAARHLRMARRIHRAVRPRAPDDARVVRRRVI